MTDIYKPSEQIAENANCSIDKLAMEIAAGGGNVIYKFVEDRVRLGILEGMKLQRERDAAIAESLYEQSALVGDCDTEIKRKAVQQAASAIRSAL